MMTNEELLPLQRRILDKQRLEAKLRTLQDQRRILDRKMVSLKVSWRQEQEDVEALEVKSLTNYFLKVVRKLDDRLDAERREAYAAKVKLDAVQAELTAADEDIADIHRQLSQIQIDEENYRKALDQKRAALKESSGGADILRVEQTIAALQVQKKEIQEAISAGCRAKGSADRILSELEDADGWNTWDILGGSGILTHAAKYSHLDEAQNQAYDLQDKLRRFQTELADIQIHADLQVTVEGFLRFADYFFDGLFADWAVADRIGQSTASVQGTCHQISRTLDKLSEMETALDREIAGQKARLEDLLVNHS